MGIFGIFGKKRDFEIADRPERYWATPIEYKIRGGDFDTVEERIQIMPHMDIGISIRFNASVERASFDKGTWKGEFLKTGEEDGVYKWTFTFTEYDDSSGTPVDEEYMNRLLTRLEIVLGNLILQ